LLDKTNQAWLQLLTSPTATVNVTNDRAPVLEVSP
jgi:hypothetical protein